MLENRKPVEFKRAVFVTENAYYENKLDYRAFCDEIAVIGSKLKTMIAQKGIGRYKTAGNWAAFSFMTDTIAYNDFKPFTYDFDDFMASKDWSKMFVTKLLKTHGGNCHSLPYLYKIICEEIGAKAYLALAPNHIYIKHQDEKGQWANVELTNGSFPRDQWIIKEMAISVEAIKRNIYMAPLSPKESIAETMFDLALGYKFKFGYDSFVLQVINTALKYSPKDVAIIQLKANCIDAMIKAEKRKNNPDKQFITTNIALYKNTLASIDGLGYKDMPVELYQEWVKSVEAEKRKRNLVKTN
jgi:hypothetical protein